MLRLLIISISCILVGFFIGALCCRLNIRKYFASKDAELERISMTASVLAEWMALLESNGSIASYFVKHGYKNVAIYGMGVLGHHVYMQLLDTSVEVKCLVDKREIKGIYEACVCKPEDKLNGVDVIVITPIHQYETIKDSLSKGNSVPIVSIRDILE